MIDENKIREYIERGARLTIIMEAGTFITGCPKRILEIKFLDVGKSSRVNFEDIERMEEA
jgi:hypothetical protein